VKDGVCDQVVCERWCVTKLCVKEGVCDKVVGDGGAGGGAKAGRDTESKTRFQTGLHMCMHLASKMSGSKWQKLGACPPK
jgi:hypothetical protein